LKISSIRFHSSQAGYLNIFSGIHADAGDTAGSVVTQDALSPTFFWTSEVLVSCHHEDEIASAQLSAINVGINVFILLSRISILGRVQPYLTILATNN